MQRKKSRFLVFILSFIPGAGEMYMGFMRMGLSLMLGFMILTAIVGITNLGALAVFPIAMYAYSFFHANNLATMDDRAFQSVADEYLFGFDNIDHIRWKLEGRNRTIAAAILIILGIMMLWQVIFNLLCDIFGWDNVFLSSIYYFVRDELPRVIVGIGVIWAGLALIRGKRMQIEEDPAADDWQRREEQQTAQNGWQSREEQRTAQNGWQGREEQQSAQNGWQRREEQQTAQNGWQGREEQRPVQNRQTGQWEQQASGHRQAGYGEPSVRNSQAGGNEAQSAANGRVIYGEGPTIPQIPENRN